MLGPTPLTTGKKQTDQNRRLLFQRLRPPMYKNHHFTIKFHQQNLELKSDYCREKKEENEFINKSVDRSGHRRRCGGT